MKPKGVCLTEVHFGENLERIVLDLPRPVSVLHRVSVQCRFHCTFLHISLSGPCLGTNQLSPSRGGECCTLLWCF